jgi:hypothetical protein
MHTALTATEHPLWLRIVNLFEKHGLDQPPTRLRDELVVTLDHALAFHELKVEHENVMDSICRINR